MSKLQETSIENLPNLVLSSIACTENVFNGIKSCGLTSIANSVKIGLCINCERKHYCIWQENRKISCEHYQ